MTDEKKPEDEENAIPEVEAEIVTDDKQGASEDAIDAAAEEPLGEPVGDPVVPPKSFVTPGMVLFGVFVLIAGMAFTLWRMQSGDAAPAVPTAEVTEPEAQEEAAEEVGERSGDETPAQPEDAGKIDNPAADLKDAFENTAADPTDSANVGDQVFLPPAPEEGAGKITNDPAELGEIKDAAEVADPVEAPAVNEDAGGEAPIEFDIGESAAGSAEDAVENVESGDQEPSLEETSPEDKAASAPASENAELMEAADAAAADTLSPDADTSRIENVDVGALKAEFNAQTEQLQAELEAERARADQQAQELETLRNDFSAALAERDRRAEEEQAALRAQLEKIQNADNASVTRQLGASIALTSLQQAVDDGEDFEQELEVLARFIPEAGPVYALMPYAEEGAPSLIELQNEFPAVAVDALAAAGRANAKGLGGSFMARVQNLVSVRPARPLEGDGPREVISRAEDWLNKGNLEGAVTELQSLEGPARDAAKNWLTKAERRAAVEKALDDLNTLFLNQLPQ